MKYLIFSDLHGSLDSAQFVIEKFNKLACDFMICLGDVLYHGPRNELPNSYCPKKVIELLNSYGNKIICIQGNCVAEVDQMVLDFSLEPYKDLKLNGMPCHLEHGHHLDETKVTSKVVLYGHTHIALLEQKDKYCLINPGSITIPKGNGIRSYIILEENTFSLYDMEDHLLQQFNIN